MNGKRLIYTLRLWMLKSGSQRAQYLRKKGILAAIGENCTVMGRSIPLYPKLIKLGNNVHIASNVHFVTHDLIHKMLNGHPLFQQGKNGSMPFIPEKMGCIEIGDNVFIGAGTRILYDVRIGSNCIIGAGSLVNKDVPSCSVVAGVPARVIGDFNDFIQKRLKEESYPSDLAPRGESISDELAAILWKQFAKKRE